MSNELRVGVNITGNSRDLLASVASAKGAIKSLKAEQTSASAAALKAIRDEQNARARSESTAFDRERRLYEQRQKERQAERRHLQFLAGMVPGGRRSTGAAGFAGGIVSGTLAAAPISGAGMAALSTLPALSAGLAPLVGILPALGTGFVGAAQGAMVFSSAVDGLKKVLDAKTPKQLELALKGLDKQTQKVAYKFRQELHPAMKRLHELSQRTLLPSLFKLGYAFTQLAKPGGAIFDGAKASGQGLSKVILSITKLLENNSFKKQLDRLLVTTGKGIGELAKIMPPMIDGFVRMSNLAAPLLTKMARAFADFAESADSFVKGHGKEITEFFDTTFNTMSAWMHGIGDVGKIFFGLSRAAGDLSAELGGGITDFLDKIVAVVNSPRGQDGLKKFFEDALPTLKSFGSLVKDLFVDLGSLGADPRTQEFVRGLFDFLRTSLLPILNDVAKAIPGVASALLPAFETIGEFANRSLRPLVQALTQLVEVALPPMASLLKGISETLKIPLQQLTSLVHLLTDAINVLTGVGGQQFTGLAEIAAIFAAVKGGPGLAAKFVPFITGGLVAGGGGSAIKQAASYGGAAARGGSVAYSAAQGSRGISSLVGAFPFLEKLATIGLGTREAMEGGKRVLGLPKYIEPLTSGGYGAPVRNGVRVVREPGFYKTPLPEGFRYPLPIGPTYIPRGLRQNAMAAMARAGANLPPWRRGTVGGRILEGGGYEPNVRIRGTGVAGSNAQVYRDFLAGQGGGAGGGRLARVASALPKIANRLVALQAAMTLIDGLEAGAHAKGGPGAKLVAGGKRIVNDLIDPITHGSLLGATLTGAGYGAAIGGAVGGPGGALVGAAGGAIVGGATHIFKPGVAGFSGAAAAGPAIDAANKALKGMNYAALDKLVASMKRAAFEADGPAKAAFASLRKSITRMVGPEVLAAARGMNRGVVAAIVTPFQQAKGQLGSVLDNMKGALASTLDQISKDVGANTKPGLRQARLAFASFAKGIEDAIHDGRVSTKKGAQAMVDALKGLGPHTKRGAAFYDQMVRSIKTSMAQGVTSVASGTKQMAALLDATLKAMGVDVGTRRQNLAMVAHAQHGIANTSLTGGSADSTNPLSDPFKAGGGFIGRMGEKGRDVIPAMLGRGEAVVNSHQQKVINGALAGQYGMTLPDLFRKEKRPHYFAGGGYAGAPPKGSGLVALGHWLQQHGLRVSENPAFGGVSGVHVKGSLHYSGNAIDVNAATDAMEPGIFDRLAPLLGGKGWHVLWRVPNHAPGDNSHMHVDTGGGGFAGAGSALGGAVAKAIKIKLAKSGMKGMIGQLADKSLKKIHHAMEQHGDALVGAGVGGAAGGGIANQKLGHSMMLKKWSEDQWPALRSLWTRESNWDANAVNKSSGASGIPQALGHGNVFRLGDARAQIAWGLKYIAERYGSPAAAWAHEQSAGWYSGGGGDAISALPGPNLYPVGDVPKSVTDTSKKKKKKSKTPKRATGHLGMPNLRGIRPRKRRGALHVSPKLRAIAKVIRGINASTLPSTEQWAGKVESIQNAIDALEGTFGLSDEQALVTMYDGDPAFGGLPDLTNFLNAHPDQLAGTKNAAEFIAKYGNGLDVPNMDYSVQGTPTGGIPSHVEEIKKLLIAHMGSTTLGAPDQYGMMGTPGSMLGTLTTYRQIARGNYVPSMARKRSVLAKRMRELHLTWSHLQRERDHEVTERDKLRNKGLTWQDRRSINSQKIGRLEDYLQKVRELGADHTLDDATKKERARATGMIRDLKDENDTLEKKKPAAKSHKPPRHQGESASAYDKRIKAWKESEAGRNHKVDSLNRSIRDKGLDMGFINESTSTWNTRGGIAGEVQGGLDNLNDGIKSLKEEIASLDQSVIPGELTTIGGLIKEMNEWSGTKSPIPAINTGGDSSSDIDAMIKEERDNALRSLALSNEQFKVFQGFAPMAAQRLVGAFAQGGVVPETGLALVHKDERIIPDPAGAFRGNENSRAGRGGSSDPNFALHIHGDLAPLMRVIDARIDDRAARVTSERLGKRSRLITSSPGRG